MALTGFCTASGFAGFVTIVGSRYMILVVNSETRIHTVDSQNTQAYYAAEAGMEKMMVDLYELYQTQQSPTVSQIQALGNSSYWLSLPGITYAEYTFTVPNTSGVPASASGRTAIQTWHRLAIAAGKNRSFPHPSWDTSTEVGTDGGTHNFMRYLENWSSINHNYMGSLVSLYYAQYNLSIYVSGAGAYSPPNRNYSFDTDFLDPSKIPPGTPRFQDLVNLGYQQVFTP